MSDVRIPHFSLPFRFTAAGPAAVTEQGTVDEIADCVQAVVRYPLGYRVELPAFGTPDQAFRQGGASNVQVQAAVDTWEPRARALVDADNTRLVDLVGELTITVQGGAD